MMRSKSLTHVDDRGHARMVDVSAKQVTRRRAEAEGHILMADATLHAAPRLKATF
jgi:cyclic pyranopterin phosphate synthase